ncbi:MAG: DUF1850 domain-containing protein [Desulfovermiculus sp.]
MYQSRLRANILGMLCLVLWLGIQPGGTFASQDYTLELVCRKEHHVLCSFPIRPGQEFTLSYRHSSDHTPVVDRFQVTSRGRIVLLEERFAWYGAGLAFHPQEDINLSQAWSRTRLHRPMDPFYLRVGRVAGHQLHIQDQTISLLDITPGGSCLWIRVRAKGDPCHE